MAIAVAVWFYRTAVRMKASEPLQWAAIGAGIYYLAVFLWVWLNKTSFMEGIHHASLIVGALIHYLGSVFGLCAAWLVRWYGLVRRRASLS